MNKQRRQKIKEIRKEIEDCKENLQKILDEEQCKKVLKGNIDLYIKNLEVLITNAQIDVFRIPLINEYTLKEQNVEKIIELLKKYTAKKVEIFKVHNLAESKYKSIGKEMKQFSEIEDSKVEEVYNKIKELGIEVEIIKI